MVDIKPENFLVVTSGISLIIGVAVFGFGITVRFRYPSFINLYGGELDKDLPDDVCTDPEHKIDFCPWSVQLENVNVGEWINTIGGLVVCTGFLVILLSLVGIVAGWRGFKRLLILMLVVIVATIALEAYLADIVTNEEAGIHVEAKENLVEELTQSYRYANPPLGEPEHFTKALNVLMLQGECCGITGREDFGENITFTSPDGYTYHFRNPPACTRREKLKEKKFKSFSLIQPCHENPSSPRDIDDINTEGCYTTLFNYFLNTYGATFYSFLVLLILWHILDVVLALMMMMKTESFELEHKVDKMSTDESSKAGGSIKPSSIIQQQLPKKFIPYAKTSSFVHSQVDRMRSTEIW